jgi:formamidopyrimidine-DNA glycosylase
MNELPEVETMRSVLSRDLVGRQVKLATITVGKLVKPHKSAKEFRTALEGHAIKEAQRLGRNLIFLLDNGHRLVLNPGSGQILMAATAKVTKPKFTQLVLSFDKVGELRLVDPKGDARAFVAKAPAEGEGAEISKFARLSVGGDGLALRKTISELADVGIDAIEDQIGWDRFAAVMRSRTTPLVEVLTDERIFTGLGDIYADEILFSAGLHPNRSAEGLTTIEIRRLHRSFLEIVADAIKHEGTAFEDAPWTDPYGKSGSYQKFIEVYKREGLPCSQCRAPIKRVSTKTHDTYFCEKCQA